MTRLQLVIALTILTAINICAAQQNQAPVSHDQAQSPEQLNLRYAETYLDLAKLQLQRAIDTNKQVPGTFTNSSIAAMRQVQFVAEEQLKALRSSQGKSSASVTWIKAPLLVSRSPWRRSGKRWASLDGLRERISPSSTGL